MKRIEQENNNYHILANDPSFTAWGWVILNPKSEIIAQGCIKTESAGKKSRIRKGDDRIRRINEIDLVLLKLIRQYNVKLILAELPHGSQNAQAAIMMGATAAILQTISDTLDIAIEWYSEGDAKKAVLGKQAGSKQSIIDAINELYQVKWFNTKYKDEAVADALAIHYVASQNSSILKLLR